MKIFSENAPFEKGLYTIIGVLFDQPRFKRKSYQSGKLPPLCHWFFDIFTSAKHRIRVELVEACNSQKTNLSKFAKSANGSVIVLQNCDLWDATDGVMEEKFHKITVYNPFGRLADDFLVGLASEIDFDESLSSNSSWCPWFDQFALKKFKQAIRLARYYGRTKKSLSKDFNCKDELQKAMKNHFVKDDSEERATTEYQPYIQPDSDDKKEVIIGVGADFYYDPQIKEEFMKIVITSPDSRKQTLQVLVPKLSHGILMQIELCIQQRRIFMINHVKKNGDIYSFDSAKKNAIVIFDDRANCDQKYEGFLKVRCS